MESAPATLSARSNMDGPLDFPIIVPVDGGPRWLPYKPPPLGEWTFSEAIGAGMEGTGQWVLRCYPVFEARVMWEQHVKRYHLTMNGRDFGRFRSLDVAQQRAEREIINRVRQMMPLLAIIRRRLQASPTAHEPQEPGRQIKTRMAKREPLLVCGCGAIGNDKVQIWASQDRFGQSVFYCYDCLPHDLKEIVDKPTGGQGCTGFTAAKCECLREAVTIEAGIAYCEECQPGKVTDA